VKIRQKARGGPYAAGRTRWRARHGYAYAAGSHARGHGAGCSAERSASPWPRLSPRSVSLEAFPAIRPLALGKQIAGRSKGGSATGRRGSPDTPGSQPHRRLSGDCMRVLMSLRLVKLGLAQQHQTHSGFPAWRHRPRKTKMPHGSLKKRIGMQQNGWQPHGKLLASGNAVSDCSGARQRSKDGGSTSCLGDLHGVTSSTEIASRRR
jgi:hypothetical protein